MIKTALEIIADELNAYVNSWVDDPSSTDHVLVENIAIDKDALKATDSAGINDKIVISMINLEEDRSFRNHPASSQNSQGETEYKNPPVYLNLFLLFTINQNEYKDGLDFLSYIIEFFQGKQAFNHSNSVEAANDAGIPSGTEFSFTMDLHSLNLEQINNIWTGLGGQQRPCVMYKLRMLKVERRKILQQRPVITSTTLK